jgi:hypothetical protein
MSDCGGTMVTRRHLEQQQRMSERDRRLYIPEVSEARSGKLPGTSELHNHCCWAIYRVSDSDSSMMRAYFSVSSTEKATESTP